MYSEMTRRLSPARFPFIHAIYAVILCAVLVFACRLSGIGDSLAEYTVHLTARPDVITADAGSSTTVSAEVRNIDGKAAPDGTIVDFSASLGRIDTRVRTSNGVARARMQSTLSSGISTVTAAVQGSRAVAEMRVEVLPAGTRAEALSSITVSTKKGQLLYDPERKLVDGVGGVELRIGDITISSFYLTMDVGRRTLRLRAAPDRQQVIIKRGESSFQAVEAVVDLSRMSALLFDQTELGPVRQFISLRDFKPREESQIKAIPPMPEPVAGAFLLGASQIIIRPDKEVKLVKAVVYLEGDKTVTVPFYRIPIGGGGSGRTFAYGSEGLRADIPIYLALDESTTTAVRIRRQEQSGWGYYGGSKSWETDLVRDYDYENGNSGQFAIRKVGTTDWGFRWNNRTDFGGGLDSYFYLDSPSHSDIYGNFDLTRTADRYTSSFNFRASKQSSGNGYHYSSVNYQLRPFALAGRSLMMSMSSRAFYDSSVAALNNHMGAGANLQLYAGPYKTLGSDVSAQISLGNVWGGARPGKSVYGNLGVYKSLGLSTTIGMNYNYSWDSTQGGGTYDSVSADLYLAPLRNMSTHFSVIRGLREGTTSSFANLTYRINSQFDFRALATLQDYAGYSYTDAQFGLVRSLGNQEARLFYSKSRKRMLFEFSAAGL